MRYSGTVTAAASSLGSAAQAAAGMIVIDVSINTTLSNTWMLYLFNAKGVELRTPYGVFKSNGGFNGPYRVALLSSSWMGVNWNSPLSEAGVASKHEYSIGGFVFMQYHSSSGRKCRFKSPSFDGSFVDVGGGVFVLARAGEHFYSLDYLDCKQ